MKIQIFQNKEKKIDLPTFIDSRCMICANSGGGKSYAIRKILEESHEKVMAIVLDVEGEFKTLREKFDFLLIGQSGDVPLSMNSAHLLPRKLLELNISTIIDISDLKMHERVQYAKKFLEALMELPRELWKPCIIVLDEAHLLAGQQEKQDSCHAVIDVMTRGRKRGFMGILATQRISKLHKDAVAEANNYMVGRTGLDIDMARASEILGFTSKEQKLSLRDLDAGEFYVFGTAISKGVEKEKIGKVQTTHPKVGMDVRKNIIPPTESVKKILTKLADLPQDAIKEKKDTESLQKEINSLKIEINKEKNSKPQIPQIDFDSVEKAEKTGWERGIKETELKYDSVIKPIESNLKSVNHSLKKIVNDIISLTNSKAFSIVSDLPIQKLEFHSRIRRPISKVSNVIYNKQPKVDSIMYSEVKLRDGAIRMLKAIAMFGELTRAKTKTISGISSDGTFSTYVQDLIRSNFIVSDSGLLKITEEGKNHVGEVQEMPTDTESLINLWSKHLRDGAVRMLILLKDAYPDSIGKDELKEQVGIESAGTFSTYLQDLKRNGLIEIEGKNVKCAGELFE